MTNSENSFTAMDMADTREAFSAWQAEINESIDEYILRRRKAELYALVRRVIKQELSPTDQEIVRLLWYKGKSLKETAQLVGLDKSTVGRREKKINSIIYDKLKYAMEYRFGKSFSEDTRLIIRSRTPACCPIDSKSIAGRLHNLRLNQSLTIKELSQVSGLSQQRLELIEADGGKMTAQELSVLTRLFSTTSDFIIFGKAAC